MKAVKTLLCVGPLSVNIVDVVIELSEKKNVPIALIASRRQIEAEEFGSGYVNGWHTRSFVEYVLGKGGKHVKLARDHGGPWQGPYEVEKKLDVSGSMAAAKRSYEVDIDSGLQFLHIDPSVPIGNEKLSFEAILERLFELYGHVSEYALKKGKKIHLELGTEEQKGSLPDLEMFEAFLVKTGEFLKRNKFDPPMFVVTQTGTKVLEMKNVGIFESTLPAAREQIIKLVRRSVEIAAKHGCLLKEHNTDYLSQENLLLRPVVGIGGANVAPEIGVTETRGLHHMLENFGEAKDREAFVQICYESQKWRKWLQPDSKSTVTEKAIMAGHYCFSDPRIVEIKTRLRQKLDKANMDLDGYLRNNIKAALDRFLSAFGHI